MTANDLEFINQGQIARALKIRPQTVQDMMKNPTLRVYELGRERKVFLETLIDFLVASTGAFGLSNEEAGKLELAPGDDGYQEWLNERERLRTFIYRNLGVRIPREYGETEIDPRIE